MGTTPRAGQGRTAKPAVAGKVLTGMTAPPAKSNMGISPGTEGFPPQGVPWESPKCFRKEGNRGKEGLGSEITFTRVTRQWPPACTWLVIPVFPSGSLPKPLQVWGPMCLLPLQLQGQEVSFCAPHPASWRFICNRSSCDGTWQTGPPQASMGVAVRALGAGCEWSTQAS